MKILVKNSNFIISAPIQSRLPQIWSWLNSYIHRDLFVWKYQKNLPSDIFKKFSCTNPYENSSKSRTSIYLLRLRSRLRQIWSCPNSYIHRDPFVWKYQKNIPSDIFNKFPCTNPMRIRQKLELQYISSDSGHDCAKYGRVKIHISTGTNLCENI